MPLGEVGSRGQIQGYVGQLLYANSQIEEMVESLLSRPEKPIVILQADEGPYPEPYRSPTAPGRLPRPASSRRRPAF